MSDFGARAPAHDEQRGPGATVLPSEALAPADSPAPRAPPGLWRVLGPACVTWAAVALAIALPGSWRVLVALGIAFGVIAITLLASGAPRAGRAFFGGGAVLAALLLVVGARVGVEEARRVAQSIEAALSTGQPVDLRVRLSDFPTLEAERGSSDRSHLAPGDETWPAPNPPEQPPTSRASSTVQVSGWVPAVLVGEANPTRVVLWMQRTEVQVAGADSKAGNDDDAVTDRWAPGTELQVTGVPVALEPTSGAAYGIRAEKLMPVAPAPAQAQIAASLRSDLRDTASQIPGAPLVPGFAVGDTALVTDELDTQMRASSLTHLVAVSGANCALVTSSAIWALSWLGCGRRVRAVAAAAALCLFVLVVGPDASVQRAAIMGAVLLASSYGGKRSVALPALGIAIVVLLILDPWQAWHPGFALSVVATGGIVLCAPAFTEALQRWGKVPVWIALPVAVAAAAQFACGPLLLLLQDGLPAAGLLANVLAGPAAPAGTALGLAALIAGPISGGLAQVLVVAASLPARWVEETARVTASLPGARWDWLTGVPGALLLAAVQAAALLAWLLATGRLTAHGTRVRRPWLPSTRGSRTLRTWVAALIGISAGVFIGPTLVAPTIERAGVPTNWRIVACDVGQGDAILLRGPNARPGEAILVDTGDDETLLRDCLELFGVRRISLLVLTHDDRDHVGAIAAAAPMTDAAVVAPASSSQASTGSGQDPDRPLLTQLDEFGIPWQIGGSSGPGSHGDAGTVVSRGENAGVAWQLLAPDPLVAPATTNDASLVMRADVGELSVLLLGDTGEESQSQFLSAVRDTGSEALLQADVVKVAHHGSRDQHDQIYEMVGASIGLISVGNDNGYGHPNSDTLTALFRAGTRVLRTDELGSIALSEAGEIAGSATPDIWVQRDRTEAQTGDAAIG